MRLLKGWAVVLACLVIPLVACSKEEGTQERVASFLTS